MTRVSARGFAIPENWWPAGTKLSLQIVLVQGRSRQTLNQRLAVVSARRSHMISK